MNPHFGELAVFFAVHAPEGISQVGIIVGVMCMGMFLVNELCLFCI
jgi:hypothetical protein